MNTLRTHNIITKITKPWWRHQLETFPRYWPFVRGIHRWPANSPHKGQWRGALMLYLICSWMNDWANNRDTGDLRRHRVPHDVTVMRVHISQGTIHVSRSHFIKEVLVSIMNLHYRPYISHDIHVHDDVMIWKCCPHYWPFVGGNRRIISTGRQLYGTLIFSLLSAWTSCWINSRDVLVTSLQCGTYIYIKQHVVSQTQLTTYEVGENSPKCWP